MCEYFIPHARTDRYHRMCPIFSHDKKQPSYEDEEISIGDRPIPNNTTTEILEALGTNLNFIDIWFERLDHNYDFWREAYNKAMKDMFPKIPTMINKTLSYGQKVHKIMT